MQVMNECALQCVSWMYITLLPTGWRDKLLLTCNVVLHLPLGRGRELGLLPLHRRILMAANLLKVILVL